jgi:hypothetical protein
VVAIVMARPSPIGRVLPKNTVSPMPMAATMDSASSAKVVADIATSTAAPGSVTTQPPRSVPMVTDP